MSTSSTRLLRENARKVPELSEPRQPAGASVGRERSDELVPDPRRRGTEHVAQVVELLGVPDEKRLAATPRAAERPRS